MKNVIKLKTKREFDIAEQAYAHGMSQGMANIMHQFTNGLLDKEFVKEMLEESEIEMTQEVHIGDGVLQKNNLNDHGCVIGVKDGKFLVSWHSGTINECETSVEPSDLILANDPTREW
jgi:3-deoxy-D-manno-octulosonate 8-phosphate phosphatase KdsC-like HAD superfamily phosphatase